MSAWEKIAKQIKRCKKCPLYKSRNKAVPGEGPDNAKIMIIGQGPGKKEDLTGRPFVGRAGKFLDELLKLNKINRKRCFITSIVKCFPPKNRQPKKTEAETCVTNYLTKQIEMINPKIIIIMGNVAKKFTPPKLLKNKKIIYTYHPAAGMRFPNIRKKMIKDFKKIKRKIMHK